MKLIIEFIQKPARVKLMLIKAMWYSLRYKCQIKNQPFSEYAEKMGLFRYETVRLKIDDPRIKDVKWAVYAVNRWTPWKTKCFDNALAGKKLLNQYGLPCTLYMGIRKDEKGVLIAHAWLRCGTNFVSGGNGAGYAVTGIYGDKDLDINIDK